MTRISSLLVASTLAILPISAFAQQTAAPAKTVEPTAMTATTPATGPVSAPAPGKTATTATTKPSTKTPPTIAKAQVHGMNSNTTHTKIGVPSKTVEPAKS